MGRQIKLLLILSALSLSSCGDNAVSSEISSSSESIVSSKDSSFSSVKIDSSLSKEESSIVPTKDIYFPTDVDEPNISTGVDAFIGYSPYRITHMYTGDGAEERIVEYTYNNKYCSIDSLGRITGIKEGSSRAYAITESGKKYAIKINVKAGESFRSWIRESAAQMLTNYEKRGSRKDSYVFMGDSFFDPRGFWTESNFYSSFEGKNVFLTGIGTAKTNDWMTIKKENLIDFAPKAIFVNLGVNNLINAGDNGKTLAAKLKTLFEELHYMKEDMPIYYYGIIKSGEQSWNGNSAISNAIMKEYAEKTPWLTYLDIPSLLDPNISAYLKSDNLHPNDDAYAKYAELAKRYMQ